MVAEVVELICKDQLSSLKHVVDVSLTQLGKIPGKFETLVVMPRPEKFNQYQLNKLFETSKSIKVLEIEDDGAEVKIFLEKLI